MTPIELHAFDTPNGRFPYGRLVLASSGLLYGTTSSCGKLV
jgi:hypothetical protein